MGDCVVQTRRGEVGVRGRKGEVGQISFLIDSRTMGAISDG